MFYAQCSFIIIIIVTIITIITIIMLIVIIIIMKWPRWMSKWSIPIYSKKYEMANMKINVKMCNGQYENEYQIWEKIQKINLEFELTNSNLKQSLCLFHSIWKKLYGQIILLAAKIIFLPEKQLSSCRLFTCVTCVFSLKIF